MVMLLVGPLPNDLFKGCNLVQRSAIIFFDPLMLLVFELGEAKFSFCSRAYWLNPATAIVILTLRMGFRDCEFPSSLVRH